MIEVTCPQCSWRGEFPQSGCPECGARIVDPREYIGIPSETQNALLEERVRLPGVVETDERFLLTNRHNKGVSCLRCTSNKLFLVSGGLGGTIRLRDSLRPDEIVPPIQYEAGVIDLDISYNDVLLASIDTEGYWRVDSLVTRRLMQRLQASMSPVRCLRFHREHNILAIGGGSGDEAGVQIMIIEDLQEVTWEGIKKVSCLDACPQGVYFAAGTCDGELWLVAGIEGNPVWVNRIDPMVGVSRVTFQPQGKLLVSGYADGRVVVFGLDSERPRQHLLTHSAPVTGLAFSPDGSILASTGRDGSVHVYEYMSEKFEHYSSFSATPLKPELEMEGEHGIIPVWCALFIADQPDLLAMGRPDGWVETRTVRG